jgi:exosortase/archaeosortase family protein
MAKRLLPALSREALGAWPLLLLGALALVAYRALWLGPAKVDVDHLVFLPGRLPAWLVIGTAAWLLWSRRGSWAARGAIERVAEDPSDRGHGSGSRARERLSLGMALLGALIGSGLFVWSRLTGKTDLLLPSLAAHVLALGMAARGGRAGLRAGLLPALVLLLGMQIPKPLEDEIVWQLQVWTARGAGWLLEALGQSFVQSGVILRSEEHVFHVIDSCSGLNGILILTLVALIVREFFRDADPWAWLLVVAAAPLGFVLNVLRVAYIAASPEPQKLAGLEGDHTLQGLAVLMGGTLLLFVLGWGLAGWADLVRRGTGWQVGAGETTSRKKPRPPAPATAGLRGALPHSSSLAIIAIVWLSGLAAISWLVPRFEVPALATRRVQLDLPEEKAGWTSEPAPHDLFFTGVFPSGLHRRYRLDGAPGRPPQIVDLLIGFEDATRPNTTRLLSSKASIPGPEWQLERSEDIRVWLLDRKAKLTFASRNPRGERALAYTWRPRDRGPTWESIRALLALDLSPWHRSRPRALVRLVAYAPHDGPLVLDQARQRLDRFIRDFREELESP